MATTWKFTAYATLDTAVSAANADEAPYAAIAAERDGHAEAIEVALVGLPDGSASVVLTGSGNVNISVVDDRESTGGQGDLSVKCHIREL